MNLQYKTVIILLRYTYSLVPIVAGSDKFLNILTHWEQYMTTGWSTMLPISTKSFMMIVGVIEIIAGVLVFFRPKTGGYIVAGWLVAIALTLLGSGHYIDVAIRDIVMAIGAFSLAQLYNKK